MLEAPLSAGGGAGTKNGGKKKCGWLADTASGWRVFGTGDLVLSRVPTLGRCGEQLPPSSFSPLLTFLINDLMYACYKEKKNVLHRDIPPRLSPSLIERWGFLLCLPHLEPAVVLGGAFS